MRRQLLKGRTDRLRELGCMPWELFGGTDGDVVRKPLPRILGNFES